MKVVDAASGSSEGWSEVRVPEHLGLEIGARVIGCFERDTKFVVE